jgi:hypothetical protein
MGMPKAATFFRRENPTAASLGRWHPLLLEIAQKSYERCSIKTKA